MNLRTENLLVALSPAASPNNKGNQGDLRAMVNARGSCPTITLHDCPRQTVAVAGVEEGSSPTFGLPAHRAELARRLAELGAGA
ncbi:MAG: hypothetical protein AAGN66_26350 [Acidobacteriota bacterium]